MASVVTATVFADCTPLEVGLHAWIHGSDRGVRDRRRSRSSDPENTRRDIAERFIAEPEVGMIAGWARRTISRAGGDDIDRHVTLPLY